MRTDRLLIMLFAVCVFAYGPALGQDRDASETNADFLKYIDADFGAALVIHPAQISKTEFGRSIQFPELVEALLGEAGLDVEKVAATTDATKIARVTVLADPFPGGNVAFLPGVIVEFNEDVPGRQFVRALWPDARTSDTDGKLMIGLETMADTEIQASIENTRTVLIAPEPVLEKMRSTRRGATSQLGRKLDRELGGSEIVFTYLSAPVKRAFQQLSGLSERQLRTDEETDEFVKMILLDIDSATLQIEMDTAVSISANVDCDQPVVANQIAGIVDSGLATLSLAISTPESRAALKQDLQGEFPDEVLGLIDTPALQDFVDSVALDQRGSNVDMSVEIPHRILDVAESASRQYVLSHNPLPDEGDWITIFRSADPAIWNSDVNDGPNRFAVPLSRVPAGIKYLRLKIDDERFVIVEVTRQQLGKRVENGQIGWVGDNHRQWNGRHLGIYNRRWIDAVRGTVHILPLQNRGIRGWGFGNHVKIDDGQVYAWAGKKIARTVFEISVKSDNLTDEEKEAVLE